MKAAQVGGTSFHPSKSIKWLGVSLDRKAEPRDASGCQGIGNGPNHRVGETPVQYESAEFPRVAVLTSSTQSLSSLLHGMVQLDIGPTKAWA